MAFCRTTFRFALLHVHFSNKRPSVQFIQRQVFSGFVLFCHHLFVFVFPYSMSNRCWGLMVGPRTMRRRGKEPYDCDDYLPPLWLIMPGWGGKYIISQKSGRWQQGFSNKFPCWHISIYHAILLDTYMVYTMIIKDRCRTWRRGTHE